MARHDCSILPVTLAVLAAVGCGGGGGGGSTAPTAPVPFTITAAIKSNTSGDLGATLALAGEVGRPAEVRAADVRAKVPGFTMYGDEVIVRERRTDGSVGRLLGRSTSGSTSFTVTAANQAVDIWVLESLPTVRYECGAVQGLYRPRVEFTIARGFGNIYGGAAPNAQPQDADASTWAEWDGIIAEVANDVLRAGGTTVLKLTKLQDGANADIKYGFLDNVVGCETGMGCHSGDGSALSIDVARANDARRRRVIGTEELMEALVSPQPSFNNWGQSCGTNYTDVDGYPTPEVGALAKAAALRTAFN